MLYRNTDTPHSITKNLIVLKFVFLFALLSLLLSNKVFGQTKGLIYQRTTGNGYLVLDPNNNGYASTATSGFTLGGTNGMETNSELPYRFLPQFAGTTEPLADLVTGSNGGHTDLANIPLGMAVRTINGVKYMLFRVRLGGSSTASKGYTFLFDTDGIFNARKDVNGNIIPYATPSKVKNLGFEYEVTLSSNFDIMVYHHTGSGDDGDPVPYQAGNVIWRASANGGYTNFFQRVVAGTTAGGDADYFYDFYIPLSAFSADGSAGINASSTFFRVSGATVTSAQTGLEGTISDVGGIDDKLFNNDKLRIWQQVVPAFPPTSLDQLENGEFCSSPPTAPVITPTSLTPTSTAIAGTYTDATVAAVMVYVNGIAIGNATLNTTAKTWSLNIASGTLKASDQVTAKTSIVAAGSCPAQYSVASATVVVGTGICLVDPPYLYGFTQNEQNLQIYTTTNTPLTATYKITVYKDGVPMTGTFSTYTTLTTAQQISSNNLTYRYSVLFTPTSGGQFAFADTPGSKSTDRAALTATITNGCESKRSNYFYLNGGSNQQTTPVTTTSTDAPTIQQTTICISTAQLNSPATPQAVLANASIYLFINGYPVKTNADGSVAPITTADASGNWTITLAGYNFTTNDVLSVRAKVAGKGMSGNTDLTVAATCPVTATPSITSTVCPTSVTISGTLATAEAIGTNIYVYRQAGTTANPATDQIIAIGTLTAAGTAWTATVKNEVVLAASNILYAVAQAPSKGASTTYTNTSTVSTPSAASAYSLTLNAPITQGATTISGTINILTAGTVSIYIDGAKIAETTNVTVLGMTTTWTVTLGSASQLNLAAGVPVTATFTPNNSCESGKTTAVIVSCNAPASTAVIAPATQNVCSGKTATITVSGTQSGVIYQIYNGSTANGPAMVGNGGTIILNSDALTSAATLTVKAYRIGTTGCEVTLSGNSAITITPSATTQTVSTASPVIVCSNSSATITLAGSQTGVSYQLYKYNAATTTYEAVTNGAVSATAAPIVSGTGSALTLTTPTLTADATFKVVAINSNGCTTDMTNTVNIVVPSAALTVTPTALSICSGNTTSVTIASSQLGVTYQLFNVTAGTLNPVTVAGTGGTITLTTPALTSTATFRINLVGPAAACVASLTQIFTVDVVGTIATQTLTPSATAICVGSTVNITLGSSQRGVIYQIYNNNLGVSSGTSVVGTGSAITLTSAALTAGTISLTVKGTTTSGCSTVNVGSASVTVSSPTVYNITTANKAACYNTTTTISLSGSQTGVNYQLYLYNSSTGTYTANGAVVAGTGSVLTLTTAALTSGGTFKVVATNTTGNTCAADMNGTVTISVYRPIIYATDVCGTGTTTITVSNPVVGYTYQLNQGGTLQGAAVTYSSGTLTFTSTSISAATNFYVVSTGNGCTSNSATTTVTPKATIAPTITATNVCSTDGTSTITVTNPQSGYGYTLYRNGSQVGSTVYYASGFLTFTETNIAASTNYYVAAVNGNCIVNSNTATVTVTASPAAPAITLNNASICAGSTATISVTAATNGFVYQLFKDGIAVSGASGTVTAANGTATFSVNTTGTYTVRATNGSCTSTASAGVTLTVNPLPAAPAITLANTTICADGTATVSITSPVNGLVYKLYRNGVYTNSSVTAASGAANFAVSTAGTYTVTVTSSAGCESTASSGVVLTVNSVSATPVIAINQNNLCGSGSVTVSVTSPVTNTSTYFLYRNGSTTAEASNNTGVFSNLAVSATASFTVKETNNTGCTSNASAGATVTVNPVPAAPSISISNTNICAGNSTTVLVSSPTNGLVYKLYKGGVYVSAVTAASNAASFTVSTAGTYTVTVTSATNCESAASAGVTLTVEAVPTVYAVSPSSVNICYNTATTIRLANSESNVNYQLYISQNGGTYAPTGSPVAGTGTALNISTGNLTASAVFKISASRSGCSTLDMSGTTTVNVEAAPATFALTSPGSQTICKGGKAYISIAGSEIGVTYQLYNTANNQASGDPVAGNGSTIFLETAALSVNGTYNYKVTGTRTACTSTADMNGTTSIVVNDCPIIYEVEPPYEKDSYVDKEIIGTPDLTGWTYTGPLTYTVIDSVALNNRPLTGTKVDPGTGKLYVTSVSKLQPGTRNLKVRVTDAEGVSRDTYFTYSINDPDNADGYERTGQVQILPVTLLYFKGEFKNNAVSLNWATASEKNNDYFEIERSADGKKFTKIMQVKGSGTTQGVITYQYTDKYLVTATTYYRLKQVDFNGDTEYSRILAVTLTGKPEVDLRLYPNPAYREVTVSYPATEAGTATVQVVDLLGQVLKTQKQPIKAGLNNQVLNIQDLPAGSYLIVVQTGNQRLISRMVKQ